jgi:hypothetical protein
MPVAVRFKTYAAIASSNPAECMNVCLLCLLCFVGINLCDEMITHSEKSYRVCVSNLCHLRGGLGPIWGVAPKQQKM